MNTIVFALCVRMVGLRSIKENGKYQGFKCGCEVKDIREAIRPWSEASSQGSR